MATRKNKTAPVKAPVEVPYVDGSDLRPVVSGSRKPKRLNGTQIVVLGTAVTAFAHVTGLL